MFGENYNEQLILGDMVQELVQSTKNYDYNRIYNKYKSKHDFIKNYSLIVGTDDETGSDFHTNILSEINSKKFYDSDESEITVEHHFSNYKNILYFTNEFKEKVNHDSSIFVDSNSINMFERFYNKKISNNFIDFKLKHNIDLNYLPYMMEDYINPHHKKKNPQRTLEKIRIFEIINNLDIENFQKRNNLSENLNLLNQHGFKSIDELIEDRIFYFNHFIDKLQHQYNKIQLCNSHYYTFQSNNKLDIYSILSEYYMIFGYILKILIEKRKDISTEEKVKNVFHQMVLNGRNFKHILEFSYDYFDDDRKVNQFFNYNNNWSYEQTITETYNKTWDIFLYSMTQNFITNPRHRFNKQTVDFGVSFFLTKDNKFYRSFVDGYMKKVFIINESINGRPFVTINEPTDRSQKVEQIMNNYYDINMDKLMKLKLKRGKLSHKHQYSISILFKEQMEREFKIAY
jgi:hypothetical protein